MNKEVFLFLSKRVNDVKREERDFVIILVSVVGVEFDRIG